MRIHHLYYICFLTLILSGCGTKALLKSEHSQEYLSFREDQSKFVSSDGEMSYIDKGDGEVIVLLHGVPSSSWLYRKMIDDLVEKNYRVIAPDMLGYGNSANPEGYEIYSNENHARRLLELMEHLQIENWTHVCHDAGGLWTMELLKISPDKIKNLVVLNSVLFQEGFNPPVKMKPGGFAKFNVSLYRNRATSKLLMNSLFRKGLNDRKILSKDERLGYRIPMLEGKTNGIYYFFTQTKEPIPIYDSMLVNMNLPCTVIWGKNDDMLLLTPQKEKINSLLKVKHDDVHLVDAKHFIQEEQPFLIDSLIIDFISFDK